MRRDRRNSKRRVAGFTLIEMLVVIAIIALLASIVSVSVAGALRRARTTRGISNYRQIGLALTSYAAENNTRLLGWGIANNWTHDVYLFESVARYLGVDRRAGQSEDVYQDQVHDALMNLTDPNVPEGFRHYTSRFPSTFSFNSISNRASGRHAEGLSDWPGANEPLSPRRLGEFENPSTTLYVVSGGYQFNWTAAQNEEFVSENPFRRRPIMYRHGRNNDSTIGLFLDGHVELVPFQIPRSYILPRES